MGSIPRSCNFFFFKPSSVLMFFDIFLGFVNFLTWVFSPFTLVHLFYEGCGYIISGIPDDLHTCFNFSLSLCLRTIHLISPFYSVYLCKYCHLDKNGMLLKWHCWKYWCYPVNMLVFLSWCINLRERKYGLWIFIIYKFV